MNRDPKSHPFGRSETHRILPLVDRKKFHCELMGEWDTVHSRAGPAVSGYAQVMVRKESV